MAVSFFLLCLFEGKVNVCLILSGPLTCVTKCLKCKDNHSLSICFSHLSWMHAHMYECVLTDCQSVIRLIRHTHVHVVYMVPTCTWSHDSGYMLVSSSNAGNNSLSSMWFFYFWLLWLFVFNFLRPVLVQ